MNEIDKFLRTNGGSCEFSIARYASGDKLLIKWTPPQGRPMFGIGESWGEIEQDMLKLQQLKP